MPGDLTPAYAIWHMVNLDLIIYSICMVRPLRIEYEGATYHVTSRGDRQEPIVLDNADRLMFMRVVAEALDRFDAQVWAYCLMNNHYHLVLHTNHANLSRIMRHVNGVYTQKYNFRYGLAGHLFQGRFKAILVDTDRYLLEVCRYVDLNPVRAGLVSEPHQYEWSSYLAHAGLVESPCWLNSNPLYEQLNLPSEVATKKYAEFVAQGAGADLWGKYLRQQIFLGDDAFILRMQEFMPGKIKPLAQVSKLQQHNPVKIKPLARYVLPGANMTKRNSRIVRAFNEGGYTQTQIAEAFGVSSSTVSRVIKASHKLGSGLPFCAKRET